MVTYTLNPELFNAANKVMASAEEKVALGELLLACTNRINDANEYSVPMDEMKSFEDSMFSLIKFATDFTTTPETFSDDIEKVEPAKRIEICRSLIDVITEWRFNIQRKTYINNEALRDFLGMCRKEATSSTSKYHMISKSHNSKRNLLLLGFFPEALNVLSKEFDEREEIYNEILSVSSVRKAVTDWVNGKTIMEFDDAEITKLVDVIYIHNVPAAVEIEAIRIINEME